MGNDAKDDIFMLHGWTVHALGPNILSTEVFLDVPFRIQVLVRAHIIGHEGRRSLGPLGFVLVAKVRTENGVGDKVQNKHVRQECAKDGPHDCREMADTIIPGKTNGRTFPIM